MEETLLPISFKKFRELPTLNKQREYIEDTDSIIFPSIDFYTETLYIGDVVIYDEKKLGIIKGFQTVTELGNKDTVTQLIVVEAGTYIRSGFTDFYVKSVPKSEVSMIRSEFITDTNELLMYEMVRSLATILKLHSL